MNPAIAVLLVLLIGSITSIVSKRFKIAYTKLLVVIGLAISIAYHVLGTPISQPTGELIISVVLPPLVFQAALTMNYAVYRGVCQALLSASLIAQSSVQCKQVTQQRISG